MRSFLLMALLLGSAAAQGHSGHVHTDDAAPDLAPLAEPRFAAASPRLNLVGVLTWEHLWLYADDPASNTPLDGLGIEADLDGEILQAEALGNGAYLLRSPALRNTGQRHLVFSVLGHGIEELLVTSLNVVGPAQTGGTSPALWDKAIASLLLGMLLIYLGWRSAHRGERGFLLAAALSAVGLSATALATAYLLYNATAVAGAVPAWAREDAPPGSATQAPDPRWQRLADGMLFIPKPAQTLLQLRTTPAESRRVAHGRLLHGRVIPDPRDAAVVQAEQSGRLSPPPSGFPLPGTRVHAGDLLGYLHPLSSSADRARQRAELAALEKDLYLSERQSERVRQQLGEHDPGASVTLEVSRAEQNALRKRVELLRAALSARLPLTAPVDGVLDEVRAVNGAVVEAGEQVFSLIDPARFWVEVLAPTDFDPGHADAAQALLPEGGTLPLALGGHGYRLDNQVLPLQFRPLRPTPRLMVGMLLDVRIESPEMMDAIVLPQEIVQSSPGANDGVVWVRTGAERFEARRVQWQRFDGERVLVVAGITAGEPVVTAGAALLAMQQRIAP